MRPTETSSPPGISPRVTGLCQSAARVAGVPRIEFSAPERAILDADGGQVEITRDALEASVAGGQDLLGELFCEVHSAEQRRPQGATYTPPGVVETMLAWAAEQRGITRVVDEAQAVHDSRLKSAALLER